MKLVCIESPYAGDVTGNEAYASRCVMDCLRRGESPYASHLFFTRPGILDDLKPEERKLGIEAGFEWARKAEVRVFYIDRGISSGMKWGYKDAIANGQLAEIRSIERVLTFEEIGRFYEELGGWKVAA